MAPPASLVAPVWLAFWPGGPAGCDLAGASVMVRPSLLKPAIRGTLVVIVISAAPLLSEYAAEGMVLLAKVSVGEAGAVTGSWPKVMRSLPGSVATEGLTGAVN